MNLFSQTRHWVCATALMIFYAGVAISDEKEESEAVKNLKAKEISTEIEKDEKIVILDIRTKEEFDEGHLKGAQNIDFLGDNFEEGIEKLDRKNTYVVHCRSGGRSGRAMKLFTDKGFKSILHMSDGYLGWTEAGLPTEK